MQIDEAIEHIMNTDDTLENQQDLAVKLRMSPPMIAAYKKKSSRPNLSNAARIWGIYNIQVEPYTELSLQEEWDYQQGN